MSSSARPKVARVTALDRLRSSTQAIVKLPVSGFDATIVPPRIEDCVIAGSIPLPVLQRLAELEAERPGTIPDGDDLAALKMAHGVNDAYVRLAIRELDGEPVEFTPDDVARLPKEDYELVLSYATRAEPLPGKD